MDFNPVKAFFKALFYAAAIGAMLFFAGTFFGIMGLLMYSAVSPIPPNYANAYMLVGLPLGCLAFLGVFVGSFLRDFRAAARES
ncbi:MAG: hypothetical protein HYX26_04425 [Acidobacteriales bacterium]|nr:hypothetical protein [Terriglobales bacterium]